ncbi:hypothetical protein [uncultured Megasphaera sp.]|uniref:hypothetical protein n=1 Tax=uncultured Megasphaera sp. TaxID=165188 RepID=UPI0025F4F9DD|nr:hypothetical protein [uncultured Megasphaera sp.]
MKVLVKKFTLRYNGATYTAGSVADLPDDVAAALVEASPKEFSAVDAADIAAPSEPVEDVPVDGDSEVVELPPVDFAKNRKK